MNMAAKVTQAFFQSQGIPACEIMGEDGEVLRTGFRGEKIDVIQILLIFSEDNSDVHIVGGDFCKFPEEKKEKMYEVCSKMNNRFRWVKFYVNEEDNTIAVEDDAVIQLDSCGAECLELMIRMCSIVDEAYSEFMKAVWA